jgi:hypothetical protein
MHYSSSLIQSTTTITKSITKRCCADGVRSPALLIDTAIVDEAGCVPEMVSAVTLAYQL